MEIGVSAEITKRRSDRVSITLPLLVSGKDAAGKSFSEDTTTVMVSQHGAAIAMKTALSPGQVIVLCRHRLRVPREAECHVVGPIGKQANLHIYSVSFRKPAAAFWDIYFPPLPPGKDTAGRALLVCTVCGTRKIVHLDAVDLSAYNNHRQLTLRCEKCLKATIWVESPQEATKPAEVKPANPARLVAPPPPLPKNQRQHRRVAAEIPLCIRQSGSEDTVASTVDISRGGLRFASFRHYPEGSYIQVAVPYSPTAVNVFVDARVVHSSEVPSQGFYWHGVMYLAENLPFG